MARQAQSRLGRVDSIVALGQWVWDRIKSYVVPALGGGIMYYLAAVTDWLNAWGPIAYGGLALVAFLILLLGHGAWSQWRANAQLTRVRAEVAARTLDTALINPLAERFFEQRVRLQDLQTPAGLPIADRTFEKCELIGPAVIVLVGSEMMNCEYIDVQFAKVKDDAILVRDELIISQSRLSMTNSSIRRCKIFSVLFLVRESEVATFESGIGGQFPWIN